MFLILFFVDDFIRVEFIVYKLIKQANVKFKINVGVGNKVIIIQDCPNKSCDSKEMLEYAMQLRSVDEGSTVFSECPKCGIKFTVNN